MAFSATIQNIQYMGPGSKQFTGIWSGASGDAAGTMSVAGTVYQTDFDNYDSTNSYQVRPRCTVSTSSGISTLTINNQADVTNGVFVISVLGG